MNWIDLHTHSLYSDGTLMPAELVELALKNDCKAIALTDHDTVRGLREAREAGERLGVEVVNGIELSSFCTHEIHILGYFFDDQNQRLREKLEELVETRNRRNRNMLSLLQKNGYEVFAEDLPDLNKTVVTRAHIASALVKKGYAQSVPWALKLLLSKGEIGYVPREVLSPQACIGLIRAAGGKAYLAHLNQIKLSEEKLLAVLAELKEMGLSGIEGYYSEYDRFWTKKCRDYLTRFDFTACGGSDFHGANKPVALGSGFGNLRIPYSVLENMRGTR